MNTTPYTKLIQKIAHKYSYPQGNFDKDRFETLVAIGNVATAKALQDYNPNKKVKESTVVFSYARNEMVSFLRKENGHTLNTQSIEGLFTPGNSDDDTQVTTFPENIGMVDALFTDSERSLRLKEMIQGCSTETQEIVTYILKCPEEIIEEAKSFCPKNLRGALKRILRDKEWKWEQIYNSFREIKEGLREI